MNPKWAETCHQPAATWLMTAQFGAATRGVSSKVTLSAITCVGSDPMKCAWSMISRETLKALRVRNTIVPSTRGIRPSATSRRNCSSVCGICVSEARIASMPVRQVIMMMNSTAAKLKGTQPPSAIFIRLAAKNPLSTQISRPATTTTNAVGHFQTLTIAW